MGERVRNWTLYETVANRLRQNIASGRYPSGKLPSQRELCRLYQASLPTIQNAISLLIKEKLVAVRPRSGIYVTASARRRSRRPGLARCVCLYLPPYMQARQHAWSVREDYLLGANHAAHDAGVQLRVDYYDERLRDPDSVLSPDFSPWEQGCVFVDCNAPGLFRKLSEAGIPFVHQTYVRARVFHAFPNHCRNWIDKADAVARAVDYLVQLGHTHIAYVGRGYSVAPDYWLREEAPHDGFVEGMQRNGLLVRAEFDRQLQGTREGLDMAQVYAQVMQDPPRAPTAIVCSGDWIAIELAALAKDRGVRVPQDLSLVGMNDEPDAVRHEPPLSTMRVPGYEQTRASIRVLTDPARAPWPEPIELVQRCELIVRATSAPPGRG